MESHGVLPATHEQGVALDLTGSQPARLVGSSQRWLLPRAAAMTR
jgi:hypothetical protein